MDEIRRLDYRPALQAPPTMSSFFSAAEARVDRWRTLNRIAKALASGDTVSVDKRRKEAAHQGSAAQR